MNYFLNMILMISVIGCIVDRFSIKSLKVAFYFYWGVLGKELEVDC